MCFDPIFLASNSWIKIDFFFANFSVLKDSDFEVARPNAHLLAREKIFSGRNKIGNLVFDILDLVTGKKIISEFYLEN